MQVKSRVLLYIFLFLISIISYRDIYIVISAAVIIVFLELFLRKIPIKEETKEDTEVIKKVVTKNLKQCKYCKKEIDEEATVCPNCRRNQSISNNPVWLIPIFIIIGLFFYCLLSPNAPDSAREIFCSLGIRKGYPYCYKIDTEKLDNYLNNYNFDY